MIRRLSPNLPRIATIGAAALLLTAGGTLAQSRIDTPAVEPRADDRAVAGKVVDVERRPDLVTMLRLDNGATLQVTAESQGPGQTPQMGDSIVARYAETGGPEKIATHVKVIEMQAP